MQRVLIYSFSGELAEITHLFPNERLGRIAAIARACGHVPMIVDRANAGDLLATGADFMCHLGEMTFTERDALYDDHIMAEATALLRLSPDLVFVNLWQGAGFKFCFDLVGELKRRKPGLPIYGVGQKIDWFGAHILELEGQAFDGLVAGLGFSAIDGLCRGLPPTGLPAMIHRSNGVAVAEEKPLINPDDYPEPLYDPDVYLGIENKLPIYSVTLSNQACPSHCVYCVRPANYGHVVKRRGIGNVFGEMQRLYQRYGVTHFHVEDSTPPKGALTELARAIVGSSLEGKVLLSGFARVDTSGTEDFTLLKRAGFVSLFFGIESLSQDVLDRLKKGITVDAIRATLTRAHDAGLRTVGSFIFPTPGETEASMNVTLAGIKAIKEVLDSALVLPAGVYPSTPWGRNPESYGIQLVDDFLDRAIVYPVKYLVPMRLWPPYLLSFDLMGKPASEVTFEDIVTVQERFLSRVRKDLGIPAIPDYYFALAERLGRGAGELALAVVGHIVSRDYAGLMRLLGIGPVPIAAD